MEELLNDGQRLLGAKEARQYLNNMPRTTFYRNIKRNLIPRPRYMCSSSDLI
jgi:predicted DNA-binding transcriptional regulator AlpA